MKPVRSQRIPKERAVQMQPRVHHMNKKKIIYLYKFCKVFCKQSVCKRRGDD